MCERVVGLWAKGLRSFKSARGLREVGDRGGVGNGNRWY